MATALSAKMVDPELQRLVLDVSALLAVAECISRTEVRFERFSYCCGAYLALRTRLSFVFAI